MPVIIALIIVAIVLYYLALPLGIALGSFLVVFIVYKIYENMYFKGKRFHEIKNSVEKYINNCNELNSHIEGLKSIDVSIKTSEYGSGNLSDNSKYNYSRGEWEKILSNSNIYNCSANICKSANDQPFKYLCKYFNISINEESLNIFETLLNNFAAVEQGKKLLQNERDTILDGIKQNIPFLIFKYGKKKLITELGFVTVDFSDIYFPVYTFQYVSPGGNSSMKCSIKMDIDNLDKFVNYLNDLIKFKKSIQGQRALMTTSLREKIKIRDGYTCKQCGISIHSERNLLLEIDHIIPLSKGGITSEDNLQTLCWKCNRAKGAKILV